MLMEMFIKVNGLMIKLMGRVNIIILMAQNFKDNG